jgi:hypothetical protein
MMNKPYGASPLQRQRELDAFEEQRQAYNTAMRDYEEANQQPVANFDAGGEVRKMYLEQTGREPDKEGLEYFKTRFEANIDADELAEFRKMAGQEVINNDIRKAAAAEQAAAATAADAVARQQATAAAAAKKVTDIAAGTAGMEAAAGSVAAGQLAAINQAAATTGQSPAEQQAAVVRQLTAQLAASGQSAADFYASGGKLPLTAAIANDLMLRSMTTGASTAEFDRYGGYKAVRAFYDKAGGSYNLNDIPAATLTSTGLTGLTGIGSTGTGSTGTGSAGVTPIDYSSILTAKPLTFNTSTRKGRTGTLGQTSAATDYTSKGVGTVGDASTVAAKSTSKPLFGQRPVRRGAAGNPSNYFAYAPETLTGLAPGTVALGSAEMPLAGGKTTLKALESAPNLSPGMLGGVENAMYRTDRLGNRIYAPATKSLFGFAKGGDVDLQALLAQNNETLSDDTSEESINTDPLGSAQKMMADFSSASQANPNVSPVRKAIKQTKPAPAKSGSAKMAYESLVKGDLGAMGTAAPALKDTDSAQAQMQELARIYRLKAQASQERARGLSANTFGAPTLEGPTLTKSKLTKKRFAEGGEAKNPEGELTQEEIDAASRPAFVTPSSGKGRKEGEISKQLKSGDAYINMAKGVTELPYDIAGAPMDIAMLVRQGLTGQAPAGQVGTSDYIKSKMTELGIRPAPPADPTAKGFYTAGSLLSNLTNPAGVTRSAVKGAKKTAEAATDVAKDFQEYNRQLTVPGASYAVRPTGSTMLTGPVGLEKDTGQVDKIVQSGISNARFTNQADLIEDFWDKKARNYFTRQFGTPDDPIARGIADKTIKGSVLEELFPGYMVDQIAVGKTRYKEGMTPEGFVGPGAPVKDRFFPKYPRAMEDLTKRYDEATGIKGNLITMDPAAADPQYTSLSGIGRAMGRRSSELEADKMIGQGLDPSLINSQVGAVARSVKDPSDIISDGTSSAKDLYKAFESASLYNKLTPEKKTAFGNYMLGEGMPVAGMNEAEIGKNLLSENVRTAIEKGEPVYDINYMRKPLADLFRPQVINNYLTSLPPRELANIRFEDAVRGSLKMRERADQFENMAERIRTGKPVPDKVFSDGVSKPLLQFDKDSGLEGFAWKRIEKREATVPEGAYVGHSVGGFELGGPGYTKEKMEGFNTGLYRVYTLRDNRNRPVTTVEVKMEDANTPIVTQIKGNGRASGNTPAENYDNAVLEFLQDYLKPKAISEDEKFLTPALQAYKTSLLSKPGTP